MRPKITVVTPTLNQGESIGATIESVINQDYPNLEYFILDGGSTGGTTEVIQRYEAEIAKWISKKELGLDKGSPMP